MKIESLRIGMQVRHPMYGMGTVQGISSRSADILFNEGSRTVEPQAGELQPVEARAELAGLEVPLQQLIADVVEQTVDQLGLDTSDTTVEQLGTRWQKGQLLLKPSDPTLQAKEIPLETFFHKIVMLRNNLRVLEQKVNANEKLGDADKVELQQYISRSYGSLTTFNILFKNKGDQFRSS